MTPADEIRAALAKMTAGEWRVGPARIIRAESLDKEGRRRTDFLAECLGRDDCATTLADAAGIVALKTHTPALLAERDALAAEVARLREALHQIKRTAEMSAGIMRDKRRTGGWDGAERTADAFQRIAARLDAAIAAAKGAGHAG